MKKCNVVLVAIGIVVSVCSTSAQDHGHLNVGAAGTNQNDQLIFEESDIFETDSGFVKTLTYTNGGTYAGYYQGNITGTSLAATLGHPAYAPEAPAFGSWIFMQISSVQGPAGGSFAFWNTGATSPTFSILSGQTATNMWRLSESNGSPGTDPYGHIHGRRFTVNKRGIYTVGFRAFDLSTNGAGGGPIHTPSAELKINFLTGIDIESLARTNGTVVVTFGGILGWNFALECSTNLTSTNWLQVDSVGGVEDLQTMTDSNPTGEVRLYRVRANQILD